jgi:flagellin FlaB
MNMPKRKEDAFTGLEAAIVLIAFVTVAAVFSYVALGLGFFSTQKSQQVIHSGVTEATSNIVVEGDVYGISRYSPSMLKQIQFDIGLAAGNSPVDVDKLTIEMSSSSAQAPEILNRLPFPDLIPGPGAWSVYEKHPDKTDDLLNGSELFTIIVTPPDDIQLKPGTQFTIELKPEKGAALGLQKVVPSYVNNGTTLLY